MQPAAFKGWKTYMQPAGSGVQARENIMQPAAFKRGKTYMQPAAFKAGRHNATSSVQGLENIHAISGQRRSSAGKHNATSSVQTRENMHATSGVQWRENMQSASSVENDVIRVKRRTTYNHVKRGKTYIQIPCGLSAVVQCLHGKCIFLVPTGYSPVTVITHLDRIKGEGNKENAFDMASGAIGSSSERTYFISNYIDEQHEKSMAVERTALDVLDFALMSAERFIRIRKQREKNQMARDTAAGGNTYVKKT